MTMLSINTNVGALTAAQHSHSVNKSMETSMERLASGKRINQAADDAAGLAITTDDARNYLVRSVDARLVSKVRKDVVTNFCVSWVNTVLGLECRGRVVVERT